MQLIVFRTGQRATLVGVLGIGVIAMLTDLHADVLFSENFDAEIPGWTGVQPSTANLYDDGPMRWTFDPEDDTISESSNLFTDASAFSETATAPMLINETVTGETFTLRATMSMGDNDGAGFVFGYIDEKNFYRITFGIQQRDGFPFDGWSFDRVVGGTSEVLAGNDGSAGFEPEFVPAQGFRFDISISVSAGTVLDFSVSDAGNEIVLVREMALPVPATGKVGLMSWGMSGGFPSGVAFSNLSLEPVPLTNYPARPLIGWQDAIPGNAQGADVLDDNELGNWGLSIGVDGNYGTLNEDSNSSRDATDIEGNTHIDFISSILVAGDDEWTDYVMRTRLTGHDDDAFGVIVRFKDSDNFYRITLAESPTESGHPWQGFSIQKRSGGIWSEIFHEDSPTFIPVEETTYDLAITVEGSRLSVSIISDPEGVEPGLHQFGPFEIDDAPVQRGQIGFFSWSMGWLQADFVRVQTLDHRDKLEITDVAVIDSGIVLSLIGGDAPFDVQRSINLAQWETVATGVSGASWKGPAPPSSAYWRLVRVD